MNDSSVDFENKHNAQKTAEQQGAERLLSFIERIERLEQEKKDLSEDIKEVYSEAKSVGYVPIILRKCVALRSMDQAKRSEQEALLQTYLAALGEL